MTIWWFISSKKYTRCDRVYHLKLHRLIESDGILVICTQRTHDHFPIPNIHQNIYALGGKWKDSEEFQVPLQSRCDEFRMPVIHGVIRQTYTNSTTRRTGAADAETAGGGTMTNSTMTHLSVTDGRRRPSLVGIVLRLLFFDRNWHQSIMARRATVVWFSVCNLLAEKLRHTVVDPQYRSLQV